MKIIEVEVIDINIDIRRDWCKYVPTKNWYWSKFYWTVNAKIRVKYEIPPHTKDIIKIGIDMPQLPPFVVHHASVYEVASDWADNLYGDTTKIEEKILTVKHTGDMTGYIIKDREYSKEFNLIFTAHDDNALKSTTVKCKYRTLNCNVTIKPIKAEFYITDVNTNKTEYYVDETVYVSAKVVNKSSVDGYANISIKVDGKEVKTDRVYVIANYYQNVSYKISNLGVGSHEICIGVK